MKRFKIYSIILLVCFFCAVFFNYGLNIIKSVRLSNEIENCVEGAVPHLHTHLYLDVIPQIDCMNNAINKANNEPLMVLSNNISIIEDKSNSDQIPAYYDAADLILQLINISIIILYILVFILFVKIMRAVIKEEFFENKIIKMLRRMGIYFLVLWGVSSIWRIGRVVLCSSIINLDGLRFSYLGTIDWWSLLMGLLVMVFAEILHQAVLIKQENDLTI